jgi:hypothetical protein
MEQFKKFDFVIFHTPMDENEKKEVYLVLEEDEEAMDVEFDRMKVMEIHQTLSIPAVNTFSKEDFKLFYRPTEEEKQQIIKGDISSVKK